MVNKKEAHMKTLIAVLLAAFALGGCIAVPYGPAPGPAGYYYGPPVGVSLDYGYHGGGYRHGRW